MGNDLLKQYNLPYEAEMRNFKQNNIVGQHLLEYEAEIHYFQHSNILRDYTREDMLDGLSAEINPASDVRGWQTMIDCPLPHGDLPITQQLDKTVGCTQAVIRSINEYFGGQPIKLNEKVGADFRELVTELHKENKIKFSAKEFYNNFYRVGAELKKGHPAAITYQNGEVPHTVGINRIQIQQKATSKGTKFKTRAIIQVMDPQYSRYQILSEWDFNRGTVRVAIPD